MTIGITRDVVLVVTVVTPSIVVVTVSVALSWTEYVPAASTAFGVPESTPLDESLNPAGSDEANHLTDVTAGEVLGSTCALTSCVAARA